MKGKRKCRDVRPWAPGCSPELTAVSGEEISRLQVHSLWPTVLSEGSAYTMAEPSVQGRDSGWELCFKLTLPGKKQKAKTQSVAN